MGSFSIALGELGQARRHAGRSQCWQARAKKSKVPRLGLSNQSTRLRYSPGPKPCSCLQATSQLLQPVQRSRSIIKAKRWSGAWLDAD